MRRTASRPAPTAALRLLFLLLQFVGLESVRYSPHNKSNALPSHLTAAAFSHAGAQ